MALPSTVARPFMDSPSMNGMTHTISPAVTIPPVSSPFPAAPAAPVESIIPNPPTPAEKPRRRPPRAVIAAVPVVAVNLCAFAGQFSFLHDHLHWPLAGVILVALTLESIAVYIAYHAHVAQAADDPSFRLRLAAELFALVISALNYSHYAGPHWRPTFAAVTFALFSAISPWLWGIHSHRESRDTLKARGLIEPHSVRLGTTRWLWHPIRCARVYWLATWEGIDKPSEAIAAWEARRNAIDLPPVDVTPELLAAMSHRERIAFAFGRLNSIDSANAPKLLDSMGVPTDPSTGRKFRAALEEAAASQDAS